MLDPVPTVSPSQLAAGQKALVRDLAWSSICGSFSGGVILAAFALKLGATPLHVGLLAAIPFMSQALQLPASMLVEHMRKRRRIGVLAVTGARLVILAMALLPFIGSRDLALDALVASQAVIAGLNAVGSCAINSWLHQLIPHDELGNFFARRLFSGTALACVGTLGAGALIEHMGGEAQAYGFAFVVAALAGFVSSRYMAEAPEPQMHNAGPPGELARRLFAPFRDGRFRRLLVFLGAWTAASNLAAPFLTVYLIEQRGYPLGLVTSLWVTSQVANAVTLYLWGRLSDAFSNKGVLAVALPANFLCMLALTIVDTMHDPNWQLAMLFLIHLVLGVATGGIGLATGNLGLKLAPPGQGTPYLASIGLVSAFAGGIAPIAAGLLAETLKASELSAVIRWATPGLQNEVAILSFAHWEFVFGISAILGLYVMHALSRVDEGTEVSERQVVQAFALEAWRSINNVSSVAGALGSLFPFERMTERRKWWRERAPRRG